ncbi:MAG: heavy metal-binding domain-containing protein [Candidatus Omnitrophota bacterium]|nr:heavy metal-binding domain-containing protein [Candidatus Omnitrophota bacterium]
MEKYIIWILLAGCVVMHLWMMRKGHHGNHDHDDKNEKKEEGHLTSMYTCPMHPEIKQDTPGMCPECGMNLVKKNN